MRYLSFFFLTFFLSTQISAQDVYLVIDNVVLTDPQCVTNCEAVIEVFIDNTVDVYGFQILFGAEPQLDMITTGAYGGKAAEAGFSLSSNPNGLVLGFSMTGSYIPLGTGLLFNLEAVVSNVGGHFFIAEDESTVSGLEGIPLSFEIGPAYYFCEQLGCTDPLAVNYNESACIDDGSCIPYLYGCVDPEACNYELEATVDDGSCLYNDCNNDCGGLAFENECGCVEGLTELDEFWCYGCLVPAALNYCSECTIADDSCIFELLGDVNQSGTIDIIDIVMIVGFIFEQTIPDEYQSWAADWTGDGMIDIIDIVGIVDCALNDCWEAGTVMDIDGNSYPMVEIGDQVWMAENLKVTHYRNGDPIPTDFTDSDWSNLDDTETGAFAVYPWGNDEASQTTCTGDCSEVHGTLYNWYAVNDQRGICPQDWHAPSDEEWMEMEMHLGMSWAGAHATSWRGTDEGGKLKDTGILENDNGLWFSPNAGATDESGFSANPGGYRFDTDGSCFAMGYYGYFWSSAGKDNLTAWSRAVYSNSTEVLRGAYSMQRGFSVRCIRDY